MKNIRVEELIDFLQAQPNTQLIDVRTPQEYAAGYVEGFVNIPLDNLMHGSISVEQETPVIVMCHSGSRSLIACRTIEMAGHTNVYNLVGGYMAF